MALPYGITATVERPAGTDDYGNPLPTTVHTVPSCAPAPAGSIETTFQQLTVEWDLDLITRDPDADFQSEDVVTLAGDTTRYQVHGKPERWRSPHTGRGAGCVVRLKGFN